MRQKITLFIEDRMVDLDEKTFILFNYTMEDLTNPTIVRNAFSQTITLKGTANNNKVFGDIFRLDRVTQYGETTTGVNFSVIRKTPFTIFNEQNEVLESGYLKLDEVVRNRGMVEYKVTLYGGLGLFLYNLMYKEDGTKKSLVDIRFATLDGGHTTNPGHFGQVGGFEMLVECWHYLADPQSFIDEFNRGEMECWWANIINFAPAYNGIPDNFSADKAVVTQASFENMPSMTPKVGASSNLMVFTNPHTEWEMKDLRWYLQRPVISIRAIFEAACDPENNGGWNVSISQELESQDVFRNGWMTLPLIPAADRAFDGAIVRLLSSMKSPAEYILSFAKAMGLVFVCTPANKTIEIMPRAEFYAYEPSELIDLTDRVNVDSIKINHALAGARIYQFGSNVIGEWAKKYKEDFGVEYAVQRINTGNEFNTDTTIITDGIVFKDAVEVQERNLLFVSSFGKGTNNGDAVPLFRLPRYEGVVVQSFHFDIEQGNVMDEINIETPYDGFVFWDNPNNPLSDYLPKVQFHEEGNKAVDGSEVLLMFNESKDLPTFPVIGARLQYRLTDDTPDMTLLNDGVPCWNFTDVNSRNYRKLPSFRRCRTYKEDGDEIISESFEWGLPMARGVNQTFEYGDSTLFEKWWKFYLSDRYDDDTFRMTCKVNMRGLQVGQSLMRRFFFYQGSVFVLNKIVNHSLTTMDDTECEFVKVQRVDNYLE